MEGRFLHLILLNILIGVANAFSSVSRNASSRLDHRRAHGSRDLTIFSTPPPLSSLSGKDDNSFDDYTTGEITKMKDVILSLSEECNDESRRSRLKQIMEVGLEGPDGGPKRFAVLFDRVLAQVGEQVQQEAREKYADRAAEASSAAPEDSDGSDDPSEDKPPPENHPKN